jgi:hypothetical protein
MGLEIACRIYGSVLPNYNISVHRPWLVSRDAGDEVPSYRLAFFENVWNNRDSRRPNVHLICLPR